MNTYIQINNRNHYVVFNTPLDNESFEIGTTFADFESGKWVQLTSDQVAFHEMYPDATVEEVFEMQLTPEPDQPIIPEPDALTTARQQKLQEIADQDAFSNKFFVSVTQGGVEIANQELWIDSEKRTSLLNTTLPALLSDGEVMTRLWTDIIPRQSVDVPITWAMEKIPLLEIYAKRTYDLKAVNEKAVEAATTVEEIAQIDVKANYPHFLTFELSLDLYE